VNARILFRCVSFPPSERPPDDAFCPSFHLFLPFVQLTIESRLRADGEESPIRISAFNLVDLAGSENAKMTNIVGERAREAKHINQSLLTLSLIIRRLSEGGRQHLPFRDSKLTRLLEVRTVRTS